MYCTQDIRKLTMINDYYWNFYCYVFLMVVTITLIMVMMIMLKIMILLVRKLYVCPKIYDPLNSSVRTAFSYVLPSA